jgi:hypothetical protein
VEPLSPPVTPSALSDAVGDATTVLLSGPTGDPHVLDAGLSLLADPVPGDTHVIWVTMTRSPAAVARTWADEVGDPPGRLEVIAVGETASGGTDAPFRYSTEFVRSPSDLTALGVRLTESTVDPDADAAGPKLWFESLSTLLQYVDVETAFQFLHVLRGRLSGTGTTSYYRIDPTVHDPRTIRTVLSICDAHVRVEDGEISVERR